jgi:hypothetical protein
MKETTQILIALQNANPAALTALSCLRRYLGYGEDLLELRRRVLWELSGPAGEDPQPVIDSLRRGGELWNPNKETARIRREGQDESLLGPPAPGEDGWESLLAWAPDRDLAHGARALAPYRTLGWSLGRGTLWSLRWREGDAQARWERTQRAAISAGSKDGLLVHPQLEDWQRILAGTVPPWLPESGK